MAVANGWPFEALVYEGGSTQSRWASDVLARAPAADRYEVAPDLYGTLSRKDEPYGLHSDGRGGDVAERKRCRAHRVCMKH